MSLHLKLPILIIAMMIIFASIMASVMLRFQRETTLEQFNQSSAALNTAMLTSIEQDMLLGGLEYIKRGVERVAAGDEGEDGEWIVNSVTVYSTDEALYASAGGLQPHHPQIRGSLADALAAQEVTTAIVSAGGQRELYTITPILNSPECSSCHSSDIEILGAIGIGLDMSTLDDQLQRQNTLIGISAGVAFLVMGGSLSLVLRRTVLGRLSRLSASALDISHGMYKTRVTDVSGDEIGILGSAFNEMAVKIEQRTQELEQSRRELELWNVELNERVQRRTKELSAFSEVSRAVSHSLDPDTILKDVLEKLVTILDTEGGAAYLLDGLGERLEIAAKHELVRGDPRIVSAIPVEADVVRKVTESRTTMVVGELVADTPSPTKPEPNGQTKAYAVAPLLSKGQMLGAIVLYGAGVANMAPEALRLFSAVSDEIGIGIDNALTARRLREASSEIHHLLNMAIESGFEARFENPHLVKCWVEKECDNTDCPAYGSENLRCWQVAGVFALSEASDDSEEQVCPVFQENCPVYLKSCARDEITAIGENFNNMMFLLSGKEDRLLRNNAGLSTLVKCAQIIGSTNTLQSKLQDVMRTIGETVPGTTGVIFLQEAESGQYIPEASYGCDFEKLRSIRLNHDEWVAGLAALSTTAGVLTTAEELQQLSTSLRPENSEVLQASRPRLTRPKSLMFAPLVLGGTIAGILCFFNLPDLQTLDIPLGQTLADQIVAGIENDRLYQEVQRRERRRGELLRKLITAQEEERKRIARELHDEAGQAITALMMSTSMAAASLPEHMKEEQARFLETNKLAREVLSEIRKIIVELRPAVLDDLGLIPAIRWYAKNNLETANIETDIELDGVLKQRLPTEIEVTVFRVAQEAFTNIIRHSEATKVRVALSANNGFLSLTISDNGKGFAPEQVFNNPAVDRGWGLRGMQERVILLSGSLEVTSGPDIGTTISVQIPLKDGDS